MQTISQNLRRWLMVLIVTATMVFGYLVGVAEAADANLGLADASLEKAIVLLQHSSPGEVDAKKAREVQRHIDRAIANAEKARAEIAKATAAADS